MEILQVYRSLSGEWMMFVENKYGHQDCLLIPEEVATSLLKLEVLQ